MSKRDKKNIAVFMPILYQEFTREIRQGIESQAKEYDFNLVFFTTFSDNNGIALTGEKNSLYDEGEKAIFRMVNFNNFDAVIMLWDEFIIDHRDDLLSVIYKHCKCPVVNIRTYLPGVYNIMVDDNAAFYELIQHLIVDHGCRKLNFVSGPKENPHSMGRLEVYKKVLSDYYIEFDENRIYYGNFWKNSGEPAIEQFYKDEKTKPDAIICANDFMAIGVINGLNNREIKIPEDVIVVGYDDVKESEYHSPALTTVRQPVVEMGQKAVEVINDIFNLKKVPEVSYVKAKMIRRQSCGCEDLEKKSYKPYSTILSEELEKVEHIQMAATTMVTFMANVSDFDDFLSKLCEFTSLETGFDDFALCLAHNWETQLETPSVNYATSDEEVNLVAGMLDGKRVEPVRFSIKRLLPENYLSDRRYSYYIMPIHYQTYYMGYLAVSIKYDVPSYNSIKAWLLHMESALENVRIRKKLNKVVGELENLYVRDTLTGLYNRRGMDRYLKEFYDYCKQNKSNLMVMELDMDGLKHVNDTYGHADGDICIIMIANAMVSAAKHNEVCIRSGGDEYIVLGRDYTEENLKEFIDNFNKFIEHANKTLSKEYTFGASIGYYMDVPDGSIGTEEYIKKADEAMYEDKKKRKAISR